MKGFRLFLLIFAVCAAAMWLVGSWLWRTYGGDVATELQRIQTDARSFAGAHQQNDCAPEALLRLAACDGIWCQAQTPIFTRECLRHASPSDDLCDPVPDSLPAAFLWTATECDEFDLDVDPEICSRILREIATECFAPRNRSR